MGTNAVVRQRGKGAGHLKGSHLDGAQRQRRQQRKAALNTHPIGHITHLPDAHVLGDARGRRVQGLFHGLAHGHPAVIPALVVLRGPTLTAEAPRERRIFHIRRAVISLLTLGRAVGQGGQIDERLEYRAGLAFRLSHAVELGLAVVPPAHHGLDLAGLWFDHHQGTLEIVGLGELSQVTVVLFELHKPLGQGRLRGLLELQVEAGEDAQSLRRQHIVGVVLGQLLLHIVGEIRRAVGDPYGLPLFEDFLPRPFIAPSRNDAVTDQLAQDDVTPSHGLFNASIGRVPIGRPDKTCQHGRLADGQLFRFLHEVESRSLPDAEDPLGAVLAEIDFVQIVLEDLVLGVHPLRHQRHERFLDLALKGAITFQEEVLHQLLGQGTAALHDPSAPQVGYESPQHRHRVHTAVIVEALVLHRQNRLPHSRRHLVQPDDPPLFADAIVEPGHHLGFQLKGRQDFPVVEPLYAVDGP